MFILGHPIPAANYPGDTHAGGHPTGHQRRTGGTTNWMHVKAIQLQAILSKLVDGRRVNFASMEADLVPAHVIGYKKNNVRL